MPGDQDITYTLTTPDGREADIAELINEQLEGNEPMATATKDVNAEAVDKIAGTCRERINEMIDDLLKYVDASKQPGKITLAVTLGPVKESGIVVEGAYWLDVVPTLNCKGVRSEGASTIERIGKHLQLKIAGLG